MIWHKIFYSVLLTIYEELMSQCGNRVCVSPSDIANRVFNCSIGAIHKTTVSYMLDKLCQIGFMRYIGKRSNRKLYCIDNASVLREFLRNRGFNGFMRLLQEMGLDLKDL